MFLVYGPCKANVFTRHKRGKEREHVMIVRKILFLFSQAASLMLFNTYLVIKAIKKIVSTRDIHPQFSQ